MERDAASLRALVRLSLCDAADLQLARTVLIDTQAFLRDLQRYAREAGVDAAALWRQMASV